MGEDWRKYAGAGGLRLSAHRLCPKCRQFRQYHLRLLARVQIFRWAGAKQGGPASGARSPVLAGIQTRCAEQDLGKTESLQVPRRYRMPRMPKKLRPTRLDSRPKARPGRLFGCRVRGKTA